jgi:hypothetical protein
MGNYSFDTVELLRNTIKEWNRDADTLEQCWQILRDACPGAHLPGGELAPVEFYPIEVTFAAVADSAERRLFNEIGANYALTDAEAARELPGLPITRGAPKVGGPTEA